MLRFLCLAKPKRGEASAERQRQSELSLADTTIANQESADQSLDNQGNDMYADLMDRSFSDQHYSRLHIYANASVNTSVSAEYANQGFIESMQLADYNSADIEL